MSNPKQAASYFTTRFGFDFKAYQGLETGHRDQVTHVVQLNQVRFAFTGALNPGNSEFGSFIEKHGDGVKDIAFTVEDCKSSYE